ncbi:hypothetical protein BGW37DRAFT_507390 [Umbelopsis sp. PMI_123]|nr:hypothetical protein BGW37DRAFT_507390 [Umbelopsis sp. PMI_123]
MAQSAPVHSHVDTPPTDDAIKIGLEAITNSLQQSVKRHKQLDDIAKKLKMKSRLRVEVEADPKHSPKVLKYIEEDIKHIKEEEEVILHKLDNVMDRLRTAYAEITQTMIGRYVGQVKGEIRDELAKQSDERNAELMRTVKADITKAISVDIPRLYREIEAVSNIQKSGNDRMKAEVKEFFDEGKNSIVADIGKIYRQCAEQIDKVQQQADTTSEDMQKLSTSLKILEETSVKANMIQEMEIAIKSIKADISKLVTSVKVDELQRTTEYGFREQRVCSDTLETAMRELNVKFKVVKQQTEAYNRRSQELDIVYERIKSHIEQLKKEPDAKTVAEESTPTTTSQDMIQLQTDITALQAMQSSMNTIVESLVTDRVSKLDISKASSDVMNELQKQISQLQDNIMKIDKQIQSSFSKSGPSGNDTMTLRSQNASASFIQPNQEQNFSNILDPSKAISYLEAKMVVHEQVVHNKIQDLLMDVANLRKRPNAGTDEGEPVRKRTRTVTPNRVDPDLQKRMDAHTVQLTDLKSWIEPLRHTVLSNVFPETLQNICNQLISAAQRHEHDIKAMHEILGRLVDEKDTDVLGTIRKDSAAQVFKLQLDSQQRKAEVKHAELLDHVQKLKDLYAKSQEKEMAQQVQIDRLNQQLEKNTFMMNMMIEALVKHGVMPDRADNNDTTNGT